MTQLAVWRLGFRPFYLLASTFAAISVALWALQFSGNLRYAVFASPQWHAHEMLFGFALAVIVGFLLTAVRNWTSLPTASGPVLAALAALWVAARVLVLTPFAWAAAIASPGFALAAAVAVGVPLVKARNRRNYFFIGLLLLLALADLAMQLALLGVLPGPAGAALQLGLDAVLFIMAVMGGRVIPMFTNNGVAGAQARRLPGVERIALGLVLATMVLDATGTSGWVLGVVASAGALAHLVRGMLWQPWKTRHEPIVWVLHIAYLWVPLHLALRALVQLGAVAPSAATHALTVGAMGGLIIGMMTRTARGHTGRMLRAGAAESACYVLVSLAACVRVFGPLLAASFTLPAVLLSAALWCAGFALYAVRYWPFLTRPRADGRPG